MRVWGLVSRVEVYNNEETLLFTIYLYHDHLMGLGVYRLTILSQELWVQAFGEGFRVSSLGLGGVGCLGVACFEV